MERAHLYSQPDTKEMLSKFTVFTATRSPIFQECGVRFSIYHAIFWSPVFQHLFWRDNINKDSDYTNISPGNLQPARWTKRLEPRDGTTGMQKYPKLLIFTAVAGSHRGEWHFSRSWCLPWSPYQELEVPPSGRHPWGSSSENPQLLPCKELKLKSGLLKSDFWFGVTQSSDNECGQLTNVSYVCKTHIWLKMELWIKVLP